MIPLGSENDGSRPSRLLLDRYATGELSPTEAASVEGRLDDRARAHLGALERARSAVPPLDVAELRRRASVEAPRVANNTRWFWASLSSIAAAVVLGVWVTGRSPSPDVRFRNGDLLTVHRLDAGRLVPYEPGTPVGAGDVLGFKVGAAGHQGVVVLSVDGAGRVEVFWPAEGDAAEPLSGTTPMALPGTLVLDDAPGPEVFVAVFDEDPADARRGVLEAFAAGGVVGVLDWANEAPSVDAVEVTRR